MSTRKTRPLYKTNAADRRIGMDDASWVCHPRSRHRSPSRYHIKPQPSPQATSTQTSQGGILSLYVPQGSRGKTQETCHIKLLPVCIPILDELTCSEARGGRKLTFSYSHARSMMLFVIDTINDLLASVESSFPVEVLDMRLYRTRRNKEALSDLLDAVAL